MFSIVVNDQKLDTAGIKVNLYLRSTFPFTPDQGQIEGSFAFNGTLPNTPLNKRIFGFPHRLEGVFDLPFDIPCTLLINARVWYDALISITSATEISLSFDLLIGYGSFASLIEEKTLKDLAFPDPIDTGTEQSDLLAYADTQVTKAYPEVNFNFPMIYAPNFYSENPTFLGWINQYNSDHFVENVININGELNMNCMIPMIYLHYITKLIFTTFGYTPSGSFFDDPDLAKAMLYNNFALDKRKVKFFVKALSAEEQNGYNLVHLAYDDVTTPPCEDEDSCLDLVTYEYEIKSPGEYCIGIDAEFYKIPEDTCCFRFLLMFDGTLIEMQEYVLEASSQWLPGAVTFIRDFVQDDVGKKFKINMISLTPDQDPIGGLIRNNFLTVENWTYKNLNNMDNIIDLRNHVPEKEISSFLVNLQLIFGVIIGFDHDKKLADVSFVRDALLFKEGHDLTEYTTFSSKKVTLEKSKGYTLKFVFDSGDEEAESIMETVPLTNYIGEFDNFSLLPVNATLYDLAYVKNTNTYYLFSVVDGPGAYWNLHCHYHPPIVVGDGLNEVSPDMSPLLMHRHPGTRTIYPVIRQSGSSEYNGDPEDCELRFFFFHGLYPGQVFSGLYPFASSLSYDPAGNSIGAFDIVFTGTRGVYQAFLADYYYWLSNLLKQAIFKTRTSFTFLKTLDLLKIYRIFNSRFLIKEAKVSISEDEMTDIEVDCWKI